jgi:hypothetical protein
MYRNPAKKIIKEKKQILAVAMGSTTGKLKKKHINRAKNR